MDDIIPFLIIMALSLVGAIFNKKKKPNRPIPGVGSPDSDDDFMGWLNRLSQQDEEPEQQPIQVSMRETTMQPETILQPAPVVPGRFDNYSGFIKPEETQRMMKMEGASSIMDRKRTKPEKRTEPEEIIPQETERKLEFDLKQAVVYDTILNRKYC